MATASAATRRDAEAELNLPPGFRFHPTDEELVMHYLCRKVSRLPLPVSIIAELDLYQFNPWDLPERALFGRREWYFFTPRGRKYPNGSRPNRTAGRGYWKATGADKPVELRGAGRAVGIKKALVFYSGKAPHGAKTDWIMHEYRLVDAHRNKGEPKLDEWVLCRLYNKKNNWEKEKVTANAEAVAAPCKQGPNADTLSDSFQTQDSEIDSVFGDMTAAEGMWRDDNVLVKEDNDWFMDLNLDDLRTSCVGLGAVTSTASGQDSFYLPSLGSPMMRVWQTSLSPF